MTSKGDDLGDRMKHYEGLESSRRFIPLLPICARIDGRSFSNFTRGMERPYDPTMQLMMIQVAEYLVYRTGSRMGYTQSDEISLVWLQERYDAELFFDGKIHKLHSVLAAMATAKFHQLCHLNGGEYAKRAEGLLPAFDCRVFQVPNKVEASNVFLWREQDAAKNAISMAARHYYSHAELQGKSGPEMQELMFQKGVNFNDYPPAFKRGTFIKRIVEERTISEGEAATMGIPYIPGQLYKRAIVRSMEMPIFSKVINRPGVVFDGAEPIVADS